MSETFESGSEDGLNEEENEAWHYIGRMAMEANQMGANGSEIYDLLVDLRNKVMTREIDPQEAKKKAFEIRYNKQDNTF